MSVETRSPADASYELGGYAGADRQAGVGSLPAPAFPLVIAILGPTGVGKTAVGSELARLLSSRSTESGGRIISCDSMQVYAGFPVLTNQPCPAGREASPPAFMGQAPVGDATAAQASTAHPWVAHALVGCVDPTKEYSAVDYEQAARPLIEEDLAARGWALLVGGTGLYMRAALAPLAAGPGADPELRARLQARAVDDGPETLHAELRRLDPAAAAAIDSRNVRRVVRALEAVHLTGGAWSGRNDLWAPDYRHPTLVVGLVAPRTELYRRIDARTEEIVDGGGVEEVQRFREEHGFLWSEPGRAGICSAIGYAQICRLLDGLQSREETIAQLAAATRGYARRQLTWLRKLSDAVIIDAHERSPGAVAEEILALALSGEHTKGRHLP